MTTVCAKIIYLWNIMAVINYVIGNPYALKMATKPFEIA